MVELRLLGISYVVLPIEDPGDRVQHRSGINPMLDPIPGSRLSRVLQVHLAGRADSVTDEQASHRNPRLYALRSACMHHALTASTASPAPRR